ncbi:ribonuclease H-like domain-containing protein [Tanacetum coccineum]
MKNQETPKVNGKNWNEMMERELGEGYSFIKKKCFVCGSLSHLIRDCDFYEKKMAREAELKKQRVFNTGNGVAKPVWNNANRVNHANHFVPRPVQLNAVRPNSNSVRPNVNTGRANVNSVRQNVNSVRSNVNTVRPIQPDHPLKNMEDRGGSITFGGSKGYITGKGRIRVGNLKFDSVSFVKELGHFNLFSISQICHKQHKVLFTETECLTVSPDFKMPDENHILLKGRNLQKESLDEMVRPYTRKVKDGLRRKLMLMKVSTGEVLIQGHKEGKAVLEENLSLKGQETDQEGASSLTEIVRLQLRGGLNYTRTAELERGQGCMIAKRVQG